MKLGTKGINAKKAGLADEIFGFKDTTTVAGVGNTEVSGNSPVAEMWVLLSSLYQMKKFGQQKAKHIRGQWEANELNPVSGGFGTRLFSND